MAASGQAAGMQCPCHQGELLSCHRRMPLDGSSALASPAGVWKRKEKGRFIASPDSAYLVPCPGQYLLSCVAKEPRVPQLHRLNLGGEPEDQG